MARNGRRWAVALALATGRTVRDAAAACGAGERTVYTWLKDPAFVGRVAQVRSELFALAVGRLAGLAGGAADALGGLLASASEAVRLQAARAVLEYGPRLRESDALAREIDDLKRQLGDGHGNGPGPGCGPAEKAGSPAAAQPDPGTDQGGPGEPPGPGRPAAGPLAGPAAPLTSAADADPVLPPNG
jgi:hypothetical protein